MPIATPSAFDFNFFELLTLGNRGSLLPRVKKKIIIGLIVEY